MHTFKIITVSGIVALAVVCVLFLTGKVESPNRLGALSSPDIQSKYLNIGGALLQTQSMTPIQATSTVICSMQSPSATSSLLSAGVSLTSSTSTGATSLSISTNSAPYVVGTVLSTTSIAASTNGYISNASSTKMSPNTYVVIAAQGSGINNYTGNCSAIWHTP